MSNLDDPKYQSGPPPAPENLEKSIVVSPDTLRAERIPPGQSRTRKWPVLHAGTVPAFDPANWQLTIGGLVQTQLKFTPDTFQQLPRVQVFADFHCVTRWSRLGNLWEGVAVSTIMQLAGVEQSARFVQITGYDEEWTTNLPLADFAVGDALLADRHDGVPLDADHGGPVRLIIPRLFAWKSAKWVKSIAFTSHDHPGFWEQAGYHMRGDPWVVNSQHPDGERYRDDDAWSGGKPPGAVD